MKRFFSILILVAPALFSLNLVAQSKVFVSGDEGYKSFRIPAIIRAPNGDLLAFCEGRLNGSSDFGNIKIVLKRSSDKGKTWSPLQVVASNDSLQAGNPAPVVDITDPEFPTGRIFLFYNTGDASESDIRNGKGHRDVLYKTSIDNGRTWNDPIDITTQVNRIDQPAINPQWNFKEDWRSYANTPGHGFQFENGKYKGRIYIAANHSTGLPQQYFKDYRAHGFYTDDHGATFHLSETVPFPGSNESSAAPMTKGRMMMNSRNQTGKHRIVSLSSDGGATWDTTFVDYNLADPICEGSLLNIGTKKGKTVLAFCNNVDTSHRDSLTLHISFNCGKTWRKNFLIESKNTGYSDIVKISKKKIGVLYEADEYRLIRFQKIKL